MCVTPFYLCLTVRQLGQQVCRDNGGGGSVEGNRDPAASFPPSSTSRTLVNHRADCINTYTFTYRSVTPTNIKAPSSSTFPFSLSRLRWYHSVKSCLTARSWDNVRSSGIPSCSHDQETTSQEKITSKTIPSLLSSSYLHQITQGTSLHLRSILMSTNLAHSPYHRRKHLNLIHAAHNLYAIFPFVFLALLPVGCPSPVICDCPSSTPPPLLCIVVQQLPRADDRYADLRSPVHVEQRAGIRKLHSVVHFPALPALEREHEERKRNTEIGLRWGN